MFSYLQIPYIQDKMEPPEEYLFKHRGCYFAAKLVTPEGIDSLEEFEIRDSDVFLATYPKSGRIIDNMSTWLCYHTFIHLPLTPSFQEATF